MIPKIPLLRWILGYRPFQQTVTLSDGAEIIQLYWLKPLALPHLKMYAPGERWIDGLTVTACRWERFR